MSKRPKEPKRSASQEEWLIYWKELSAWITAQIEDANSEIRTRQKKLAARRRELRKIKRQLARFAINWNGHPSNVSRKVKQVARAAMAHGLVVTSTTGGVHSPTSWHYQGRAIDVAGSYTAMKRFQRYCAKRWPDAKEIFGPDSYYIKNGQRYGGAFPDHQDHVHVAR